MQTNVAGISDIALFIPSLKIDLETLSKFRVQENPRLQRHLERALRVTGQKALRFPAQGEDPVTMAAQASLSLFRQNPAWLGLNSSLLQKLRFLVAGTESSLDFSKPLAAWVGGLLRQAGVSLPESLSTFQVQHACAGASLGMLGVLGLLQSSGLPGESGLVLASDIARYETGGTAEVTQGAGAAAILLEQEAKLLEIDLKSLGFCSQDVDDFFRPLGSAYSKVKGRYSQDCYIENLHKALQDSASRQNRSPKEVLEESDLFVFHSPFRNMPLEGMKSLLKTHLALEGDAAEDFLKAKHFYDGIDPIAEIGNTYTASVYMVLAHTLKEQYRKFGKSIVGKKVLIASYGSGNTMALMQCRIAAQAPEVIQNWDLEKVSKNCNEATWQEYERWLEHSHGLALNSEDTLELKNNPQYAGLFKYISQREDGYRMYAWFDDLPLHQKSLPLSESLKQSKQTNSLLN